MANNRKSTKGRRRQAVLSAPGRIFKERYITDHMLAKASEEGLSREEALVKYGKNRYVPNHEAKVIKMITHRR